MAERIQIPAFLDESSEYLVKVDLVEPMPLGIEFAIAVNVDGEYFDGCVPSWAVVDRDSRHIPCSFVGTVGERQILVFPTASLGTAIWKMLPKSLEKILVAE